MNKNILLILAAILLVGGAFLFSEYRNKQAKNVYSAPEVVASSDTSSQDLDSDGDGAKDWEEILVGTNPHDAKNKPGPTTSTVSKDLTKSTENLSQIDIVSRDFFARYMELRQIGASKDKLSQQELIDRTVGNITLSSPKPYTIDEILVKADIGKDAVRNYGNEIGNIFINNTLHTRSEGVIARDAQVKEDPKILGELDPIIANQKKIINLLIKIIVPQSMSTMHLDLINGLNSALFVTQSLRNSAIDPIQTLQAIGQYQQTTNKLIESGKAIRSYFSYLGITYNPTEGGYIFTK